MYALLSSLLVGSTACLLILALHPALVSATEVDPNRARDSFTDKDDLIEFVAKMVLNAALKNKEVKKYMILGVGGAAFVSAAIVAVLVALFR